MSELIPHPKVVREKLADAERECRMLRRLYKLSLAAAEPPPHGAVESRQVRRVATA